MPGPARDPGATPQGDDAPACSATQKRWVLAASILGSSLAFIDGECIERYRAPFVDLPAATQIDFLNFVAYPHTLVTWIDNRSEYTGHTHFRNLKSWISRTYYGSEIGQKELGWSGNVFHGDFTGCVHAPKSHS